ncbi:DUF6266 family protein [Pedobacter heparinus]|uniref:Uncharacterized protein n=1 Tax=Pedobacter heparinus (strain ATCC 13125 / DSM 2366 / CIP 104194 / JCM 7457 / NBRC 12017 / NCIMB 9290 / NRRL B-14731 / HIM 762-3) TaxID=485917 RepID=C6Y1Q4_PEDHD|nr:DUF6266 family protein [Pedobacter heparinus]ACU05046.1 hypothetical protein Phep_2847 [Pedobacter heparinus DSM 2366]
MATSNGISGEFKGKLGNLVSYQLKGKTVIRHIGKSNKKPSAAQLATRQKMATIIKFLQPAVPFVNVGFELEVQGTDKNPHNAAVSYNVKNALQGQYPDITLDYSKVLLSKGILEPAILPEATFTGTLLEITWQVAADMDWGIKNDRTMLFIYCPELDKAVYVLSGARRSTGKDEIELPLSFVGKALQVYIAFKAVNGKSVSDSRWVGA